MSYIIIDDSANPLKTVKSELMRNNNYTEVTLCHNISKEDNTPCIVGIDEAGRGPVLGPMVYGVCYCTKTNESLLKQLECADSKTLDEKKRENIFELLCKESSSIGWAVNIISPNRISNFMLKRQKYSLNEISHTSAMHLIKLVQDSGVNVTDVYVDTVGPPEKYQEKLAKIFPDINITVSKKADSLFPIVSAASICAKVVRDLALKSWDFTEDIIIKSEEGWGSGYPNDPITKKFLTNNMDNVFGYPRIVRFSWSTAERLLDKNAATVEWSDDEDDTAPVGNSMITEFFAKPKNKNIKHSFFTDRCLTDTFDL